MTLDRYISTLRAAADALDAVRQLDTPTMGRRKYTKRGGNTADVAKKIRAKIHVHADTRQATLHKTHTGVWTPARRKAHGAKMRKVTLARWAAKRAAEAKS